MKLRTVPVITRGDDNLRDIYCDASDIPVATRVQAYLADEIVRRWNAFDPLFTLAAEAYSTYRIGGDIVNSLGGL